MFDRDGLLINRNPRSLTVNDVTNGGGLPVTKIVFPNPLTKNTMGAYATTPGGGDDAGSLMVKAVQDKYKVDYQTALRAIASTDEFIRREIAARTGQAPGTVPVGAAVANLSDFNGQPIVLNTPQYLAALAHADLPIKPLPPSAMVVNDVTNGGGLPAPKMIHPNPLAAKV
ncbi:MAG: hypothetical protein L0241_30765 [Planctomycetia bacterium]|nr:hypothetical protein [Planctomycetia bacterium]